MTCSLPQFLSLSLYHPPTCSVTNLLHFFAAFLCHSSSLLHLPSLLPVTPLVIMANSRYDKLRLDLFLSPIRQVLDIHQLFICVCMWVGDRELGTSVCIHIYYMSQHLLSLNLTTGIKINHVSMCSLLLSVIFDVADTLEDHVN